MLLVGNTNRVQIEISVAARSAKRIVQVRSAALVDEIADHAHFLGANQSIAQTGTPPATGDDDKLLCDMLQFPGSGRRSNQDFTIL